ncbi:hypothetical protein [Streptococcus sanguinis]|uniref:hypothetical protein n=1 Tax=Streptococcus sanguinis TaxID=1305 RepID=UPI00117C799C|nr:hypothetical protein [Streptococcus sanguinis]
MKAYKSVRSTLSRDLWYNDWRRNSVSQCNKDDKNLAGWAIIFLGRERLRKKNGRTNQIISI